MKKRQIQKILFIMAIGLTLAAMPAMSQPNPGNNQGGGPVGGPPIGGSAPVGPGVVWLLALAAGYGGLKAGRALAPMHKEKP